MKKLPPSTIRLVSSAQVVSGVASIVKELVENSLDAGATMIEVKLTDYGLDRVEVKDNGSGVTADDIPYMAKKHYTSKISQYSDLSNLSTLGFRGEALGAIAAISRLEIITRCNGENVGRYYKVDANGDIISETSHQTTTGTAVIVNKIYTNLPVRRQFYSAMKQKKEELTMSTQLLMALSICYHNIRFILKHDKNVIWQKTPTSNVDDTLAIVFTPCISRCLKKHVVQFENDVNLEMYLPDSPSLNNEALYRSQADRMFIFVNKRVVRDKQIEKVLKEYISQQHTNRYPYCYLHLSLPRNDLDVNLEPDKTKVLLANQDTFLRCLEDYLEHTYGYHPGHRKTGDEILEDVSLSVSEQHSFNYHRPLNACDEPQVEALVKYSNKENELILLDEGSEVPQLRPVTRLTNKENSRIIENEKFSISDEEDASCNDSLIQNILSKSDNAPLNKRTTTSDCIPDEDVLHENSEALKELLPAVGRRDELSSVCSDKDIFETLDFSSDDDDLLLPSSLSIGFPSENPSSAKVNSLEHLDVTNEPSFNIQAVSTQKLCTENGESPCVVGKSVCDLYYDKPASSQQPQITEYFNKADTYINKINGKSQESAIDQRICQPAADKWAKGYLVEDDPVVIAVKHKPLVQKQIGSTNSNKSSSVDTNQPASMIREETIPDNYRDFLSKPPAKKQKTDTNPLFTITSGVSQPFPSKPAIKKTVKTEKEVAFSLHDLADQYNHLLVSGSTISTDDPDGFTFCGVPRTCTGCIIKHKDALYAFNPYRLQEVLLFQKYIDSYVVPSQALDPPFILPYQCLSAEENQLIQSLPVEADGMDIVLKSHVLLLNGFKVTACTDQLIVVSAPQNIPGYRPCDVSELIPHLQDRSIYRPTRVLHHIQSEIVREVRSMQTFRPTKLEEFLKTDCMCNVDARCFHSRGVLTKLHSLPLSTT